jgi:hypothetical protein
MDVDNDEEEQKVDEEEEEQGGEDVLGTVVLSRKSKLALKDTDLCTYFFCWLSKDSSAVQAWLFKNYRPVVPVEFHSDELYAEPSPEVWSKVKMEKMDRTEFRANLNAKKYAGKERVESTAFDSDEGNDGKEGKA